MLDGRTGSCAFISSQAWMGAEGHCEGRDRFFERGANVSQRRMLAADGYIALGMTSGRRILRALVRSAPHPRPLPAGGNVGRRLGKGSSDVYVLKWRAHGAGPREHPPPAHLVWPV